ncbi:MAG: PKD domain-containing protein [Anaerolineae bacterium]|nr:PKD domain-containing protein [Anaerolineae bacterium]
MRSIIRFGRYGLIILSVGMMVGLLAACQPTPTPMWRAVWATLTATPTLTVTLTPTSLTATPESSAAPPAASLEPTWTPYVPPETYYPPTPTPTWWYPPTPTPVWWYPPTPTPMLWYPPTPTPIWWYSPTPTQFWYPPTPTPVWYPPTWTPAPPTPTPPPPIVTLSVNPPTTQLVVGQSVAISADVVGQGVVFRWSANYGTLSAYDTPAVIYTAPAYPGLDTVTVAVTNAGGTTYRSVSFTILYPTPIPPSPTATIPATPTPVPVPTPTSTPILIILTPLFPAETATPTSVLLGLAPEQVLMTYYNALNTRNYETAWAMLSPTFKYAWHCCSPSGDYDYANFVRWWERVAQVTVRDLEVASQSDGRALVRAGLAYTMKDGSQLEDPFPYTYLVRDALSQAWLLEARGRDATITGSPVLVPPDQVVRDYYTAAAGHLYNISWAMLSDHFKSMMYCCTPEGQYDFDEYVAWWDSILRVEIGATRIVEQDDTTAVVYADLAYLKRDGGWVFDPQSEIHLVLDPELRTWRIYEKKTALQPLATAMAEDTPESAVRRYYEAINARRYDLTWLMLSHHFKQKWNCCAPDGSFDYASYTEWWESVQRVEIGRVELIERSGARATVYAELAYWLRDGRQIIDPRPYIQLTLDPATGAWLFWDKGENP